MARPVTLTWRRAARLLSGRGRHGGALLGVFGVLILWSSVLLSLAGQREQAIRAASDNAANLARAFEEEVVRSIGAIDQTLRNISRNFTRPSISARTMVDADRRIAVCNRRAMRKLDLPEALMAGYPLFDDVLRWQRDHGEFGEEGRNLEPRLRELALMGGMADSDQTYATATTIHAAARFQISGCLLKPLSAERVTVPLQSIFGA